MELISNTKKAGNFTLLEILVTIGIIAVLASMLMPSLARGRDRATQISCASKCKQLGTALDMYADENDGFYPLEGDAVNGADAYWTHKAKPYFGDTRANTEIIGFLTCPGMPPGDNFDVSTNDRSNFMGNDIIFRYANGGGTDFASKKNDEVVSSEKTCLIVCGSSLGPSGTGTAYKSRVGLETEVTDGTLQFPHVEQYDSGNVIYADYHVVPVKYSDITTDYTDVFWDPTQ